MNKQIAELNIVGITGILMLGVLGGCASTPPVDSAAQAAGELNDATYDVLFATEFPIDSKEDGLARADRAMQEGEEGKGLFFYIRALQLDPKDVDLLAHIGEIQMRRGNYEMAKRAFLLARSYEPTHAPSREGLGLIFFAEGRHEQAITELQSAVENDEKLWRSHNALGVYADKADNYEIAQRHYDSALAINPDANHVLNNRGYSKFLAGDYQGATLDLYEAASERGFRQAWTNLALVYAKQGWYDDAIKTYKNVMSEAHAYNNAGHAAIENGDFRRAKDYLYEAVRLSPTYFPAAEDNLSLLKSLQ